MAWSLLPEVVVLGDIVLACTESVTDYAEDEERDTTQITGLGNSGALHIDGQRVGVETADMVDLLGTRDEDIARDKESVMDTGALGETVETADTGVALEEAGTAGGIAPLSARATPYVVVSHTIGDDNVEHLCLTSSAGYPGIYYEVGVEEVYNLRRTECGIDLPDTTLHQGYFGASDASGVNLVAKGTDGLLEVRDQREHHLELLAHG